ncbi:hypothetical protein [Streptomyces thermolilacinus]|uniref:hypothetical protein n=1 Tax=Streptomyces thermolilacinus TaxID=285540 RepID=UPI0003C7610A|nr:hypothetical protein [Streptomyces thermolilacinus]
MTACAIETTARDGAGTAGIKAGTDAVGGGPAASGSGADAVGRGAGFAIAADGSYAARLAGEGEALYPERWTLDGPEPYAVPLPLGQPEDPHAQLLPLADGRVLIARRVAGRCAFSLLYPTGPETGELPLGAVEADSVRLLPPAPDGMGAYVLVAGGRSTGVWRVAGGASGPEHVAEVEGHCSGGVWLDREGRLLALDREVGGGPVKTVAVDLWRGGEVTPLLQITGESRDRLLLADPDSGLLLIRSDAPSPGRERLGWGVLGSTRPVRFPECLRSAGAVLTPFAVQPGQVLTPEACAVALRVDGAAASWVGVWRPAARRLLQLPAPVGWFAGAGLWSREGVLSLPYTNASVPCGLARIEGAADALVREETEPVREPGAGPAGGGAGPVGDAGAGSVRGSGAGLVRSGAAVPESGELAGRGPGGGLGATGACRPVPLQQAPLTGRAMPG